MREVDGRKERDMSDLEILDIMYITFQMAVRLTMPFLLVSMVVA